MEALLKKYQESFKKVKKEMSQWEELQTQLLSRFTEASDIIQRLQVIQDSKNYGTLKSVEGIKDALLARQIESIQRILCSMNNILDGVHRIVLSLEKILRDGRHLVEGGYIVATAAQLKQRIGIKPSLSFCLDGLKQLYEMHLDEYRLKMFLVAELEVVTLKALKQSASNQLGILQRFLIDQPNILRQEVEFIYDVVFAGEIC